MNQTCQWTVQLASLKKVKNLEIFNLKIKMENYVYLPRVRRSDVDVKPHGVTQAQIKLKETIHNKT